MAHPSLLLSSDAISIDDGLVVSVASCYPLSFSFLPDRPPSPKIKFALEVLLFLDLAFRSRRLIVNHIVLCDNLRSLFPLLVVVVGLPVIVAPYTTLVVPDGCQIAAFVLFVGALMLAIFPSLLAAIIGASFEIEPLVVGCGATVPPPLPALPLDPRSSLAKVFKKPCFKKILCILCEGVIDGFIELVSVGRLHGGALCYLGVSPPGTSRVVVSVASLSAKLHLAINCF